MIAIVCVHIYNPYPPLHAYTYTHTQHTYAGVHHKLNVSKIHTTFLQFSHFGAILICMDHSNNGSIMHYYATYR